MEVAVQIIVFCALITQAPYYDCDDMWTMKILDTQYVPCGDNSKYAGCTYYDLKTILIAKKWINEKDYWGYTTLWHELKHQRCECSWHN